jgi:hypothetical protein
MLTSEAIAMVRKITVGIWRAVTLVHKSAYSIFTEFVGLLPKAVYYSFLHITIYMSVQLLGFCLILSH